MRRPNKNKYFQQLTKLLENEPLEMWTYRRFVAELPPNNFVDLIGQSENGTPIYGFVIGEGSKTVSLIAGAHSDEPVGPNTLYRLTIDMINSTKTYSDLLSRFRFLVIPHINPDGDAKNAEWMTKWPDPTSFMTGMMREPPGRDIEFGYPNMRVENSAASNFWRRFDPADLHFSLHGMQFSEGYLLLINDEWEERTRTWRTYYDRSMRVEGLKPHDHNRHGDKGFNYFGPGFTSTPKGIAMQKFFCDNGDIETARKFHYSSMEFQQERNSDVLCMVTEFPLFLVTHSKTDGIPANYLRLKEEWRRLMDRYLDGRIVPENDWRRLQSEFGIKPLSLEKAIRLQLFTIQSGLELI